MESTSGATIPHLPRLPPVLFFTHSQQIQPALTVAAIPRGEAPNFPASHLPPWLCAAARFAPENEFRFASG